VGPRVWEKHPRPSEKATNHRERFKRPNGNTTQKNQQKRRYLLADAGKGFSPVPAVGKPLWKKGRCQLGPPHKNQQWTKRLISPFAHGGGFRFDKL